MKITINHFLFVMLLFFFLLCSVFLAGCNSSKQVTQSQTDSTHIQETEKVHHIPGGEATYSFNVKDFINSGHQPETVHPELNFKQPTERKDTTIKRIIRRSSDNGRAELQIMIDKLGNIQAKCIAKDSIIRSLERKVFRLKENNKSEKTVRYKAKIPWWGWIMVTVIGIGAFILGAKLRGFLPI